ncbi:hypothetical protein TIFTF001_006599 [Ficus carica]|uniref:Uncharacterized protein n=1 Tax=Ficus carica TaxID=3494 RepID=A0AA87ZRK5_FICCA|nr:hypothetical protein TIFTF001_006599 [Ficus carica]
MATSLHPHQTLFLKTPLPTTIPKQNSAAISSYAPIRCGPRGNRGPLVKGRILSIEAIQAIQTLKRAHRSDDPSRVPTVVSKTLSRLIKADLLAALKELLRQDQCALALQVFSAIRSEYQPELSLYADMVNALSKNGMGENIDRLIVDLESEVSEVRCDDKGLIRLVRAVIAAERRESTVRIYGVLKGSGFGSTGFKADDHVVAALSKGLRRFGEAALADEVDREFGKSYKGSLEKVSAKH